MAKSKLQQEYAKQLRLLQRRIKALQKQGHTFNPKQIEAITKHKSRPTSKDIEKLKSYKAEELKRYTVSRETFNYQETDNLKKYPPIHNPRTRVSSPHISHPRVKLTDEVLKERTNYRARVLRLKKQGYDVSRLKKANELSLSELQSLKGSALSDLIYKDGKTATQLRKEQAQQRRSETYHKKYDPIYAERERIKAERKALLEQLRREKKEQEMNERWQIAYERKVQELEKQALKESIKQDKQREREEARELRAQQRQTEKEEARQLKAEAKEILKRERKEKEIQDRWDSAYNKFIPHTPEELEQWLAKNKERERYDKFKEGTMIQTIESKIQEVVNYVYSEEWLTIKLQANADTLQGLWWDILFSVEYPDNPDKYIPYEEYLQQHENEIMTDLDIILHYEATGMEGTEQSFINVMNILNQGTVTLAQSQSLGEMHER